MRGGSSGPWPALMRGRRPPPAGGRASASSAPAPCCPHCMRLRYGSHFHQFADLLLPEGPGPFPVAVLLHAGFWREEYSLELSEDLARDLPRRGWAAWNVEFRRVGDVSGGGYPATLEDVAAAVEALGGLDAPLDLDRVVTVGQSAGGHLALWAAARAGGAVRPAGAASQAGMPDPREGGEPGPPWGGPAGPRGRGGRRVHGRPRGRAARRLRRRLRGGPAAARNPAAG